MKKILAILLASFAISGIARETATIVYSWSAGDQAANYYRNLADAANRQQTKYEFIVDYKPGAGGTLAAHYILTNPRSIQATSSAFYIRPMVYPKDSHDLNKYQSLLPICFAPFSVSSSKYKSWDQVPHDKRLTIGISGLGTTTHLTALQIQQKYPMMDIVPFKSTSDAVQSTLSGQTDFAVGFVGDSVPYQGDNRLNVHSYILGISGTKPIKGTPLLINQGFPLILAKFGSPAQLVVPASMPADQYNDYRNILLKAEKDPAVVKSTSSDFCYYNKELVDMDPATFYQSSRDFWKAITSNITIKE